MIGHFYKIIKPLGAGKIIFARAGKMAYISCYSMFSHIFRSAQSRSFRQSGDSASQGDIMQLQTHSYFMALYDVATVINSSLNPQVVLQKVVEQVTKSLSCKGCTLRLLDRTGNRLLASSSYGISKGYLRKGPVEVMKSGIDSSALNTGSPVYIRDARTDSRFQYPEAAKAEGIVSVLAAPLSVEGKPVGVLRIYTEEEREFSQKENDFLMAVSHIAAIAIENARLHEALRADFELLTQYNYQIFED